MKSRRHAPLKAGGAMSGRNQKQPAPQQPLNKPPQPFAGKPLDGSQYHDVIEEQEYAERRPSQEEQMPRYSYLHHQEQRGSK